MRFFLRRDYKQVFETPEGERVLADILAFSGVDQAGLAKDPYATAFLLGKREVGLRVAGMLNRDIDERISAVEQARKRKI